MTARPTSALTLVAVGAAGLLSAGIAAAVGFAAGDVSVLAVASAGVAGMAWAGSLVWAVMYTARRAAAGAMPAAAPVGPDTASDPAPWFLGPGRPTAGPVTASLPQIAAPDSAPPPARPSVTPAGAAMLAERTGLEERTADAAASALEITRTVPPAARPADRFVDAPLLAVLTWDDGTRMAVYGRTLYGRNPAVEAGTVSVPVRDETLSLSKTHFEVGGGATGAWVADRHSTNGTVLVRGAARHPLVPGRPTALRGGDRLELGDRAAIVDLAS